MKIADFWDAMPRSPVELLMTLKKETEHFSETLIAFCKITWGHITGESNLCFHREAEISRYITPCTVHGYEDLKKKQPKIMLASKIYFSRRQARILGKVKLHLYVIEHHAMKAYGKWSNTLLILIPGIRWREMATFTSRPLHHTEISLRIHWIEGWMDLIPGLKSVE
jgi:hypothetical protein